MRLTDIAIRSLKAPPTGAKIYHCDTFTGFGVRVTAAGVKAFVLTHGKQRERVTLGRYPIISLQEARTEARRILAERTLGKTRPVRMTLADALKTFIETRKLKNRPKTAYETERLLQVNLRPLHAMRLEDIKAHHIADITDALARQGKQSLAAHVHVAANTLLRFCAQRHYIPFNPIGQLEKPTLPKSRERVLTDDELRTLWRALQSTPEPFAAIVKLLLLTGQRRGEIASLRVEWCALCELKEGATTKGSKDRARKLGDVAALFQPTICLPAIITKNKRAHTFPIGALSCVLLSTNCPKTGLLFPGSTNKPFAGWSKSKTQLDKKIAETYQNECNLVGLDAKPINQWRLHDLRKCYAVSLQRLGVKLEVIERLLNHTSGTRAGIVGVYQLYDFKEECAEAVEKYDEWFTRTILT